MSEFTIPNHIYNASVEERCRFFETAAAIAHTILNDTFIDARDRILNPGDNLVLNIFGPSGAGKSTLVAKLIKTLTEKLVPDLHKIRGQIAVVGIIAPASERGGWQWGEYLSQIFKPEDLLRKNRAWCHKCFERRKMFDGTPWESLCWSLTSHTLLAPLCHNQTRYNFDKIYYVN